MIRQLLHFHWTGCLFSLAFLALCAWIALGAPGLR